MRSCTVERARPSLRASDAVGSRALALSSESNRASVSRFGISPEIPAIRRTLPQFPALCRLLFGHPFQHTHHGRSPRRPPIRRASARRKKLFAPADASAMGGRVKPGHGELFLGGKEK